MLISSCRWTWWLSAWSFTNSTATTSLACVANPCPTCGSQSASIYPASRVPANAWWSCSAATSAPASSSTALSARSRRSSNRSATCSAACVASVVQRFSATAASPFFSTYRRWLAAPTDGQPSATFSLISSLRHYDELVYETESGEKVAQRVLYPGACCCRDGAVCLEQHRCGR